MPPNPSQLTSNLESPFYTRRKKETQTMTLANKPEKKQNKTNQNRIPAPLSYYQTEVPLPTYLPKSASLDGKVTSTPVFPRGSHPLLCAESCRFDTHIPPGRFSAGCNGMPPDCVCFADMIYAF